MYKANVEPFNLSESNVLNGSTVFYTHDLENFERYWFARQKSYTDDFEPHRSLCHKSYFMDIPIVNLTFIMENESFLVRFEDEIIICS